MSIKLIDKISLYDYDPKDLEKQLQSATVEAKKLQKEVKTNLSAMASKTPPLPKMFEDIK